MNEYELKTKMHRITQAKRAMSGAFDIDFMEAEDCWYLSLPGPKRCQSHV